MPERDAAWRDHVLHEHYRDLLADGARRDGNRGETEENACRIPDQVLEFEVRTRDLEFDAGAPESGHQHDAERKRRALEAKKRLEEEEKLLAFARQ